MNEHIFNWDLEPDKMNGGAASKHFKFSNNIRIKKYELHEILVNFFIRDFLNNFHNQSAQFSDVSDR